MSPEVWLLSLWMFVITIIISKASAAYIGMDIGTDMSNMPSAVDIVKILKSLQMTHVRLFNADHKILSALANTGIEVIVGVTNEELLGIGESQSAAADWINRNVAAYIPATNITAIAVGNEVLTKIPNAGLVLVPAMQFLQSALVASNLNFQVKISSPQSMDIIPDSFPPSAATFNYTWNNITRQFLQFIKNTDSYFMLNAHPYIDYTKANGIFPLDYALSQPLHTNEQFADPNTDLHYDSMFTAMIDAVYFSMEAFNMSGIQVLVTATGWPWHGGPNDRDASIENAAAYNRNLIRRVQNNSGTPYRPLVPVNAFIYELFNEDLQTGSTFNRNWGIMFPNGTEIYSLPDLAPSDGNSSSVGNFCVAKPDANNRKLLDGLNWACGDGGANCTAIQLGHPCYEPNTLVNHASYAYNDYYHKSRFAGGTCNFSGTAMFRSTDPSYDLCIFTGSVRSNTSMSNTTNPSSIPDNNNHGVSKQRISTSMEFLIAASILFLA